MTARPTTDQIATRICQLERVDPRLTRALEPIAGDLAAELQACLPDLAPAAIAAVLMHTSSCISGLIARFRQEGLDEEVIGTTTANIIAITGERMNRAARQVAKPGPPKNWGYS